MFCIMKALARSHKGVLIKIITDHKNLEYFMIIKKLSRQQAYWAEFLSRFNFIISYTLNRKNRKANLLTC